MYACTYYTHAHLCMCVLTWSTYNQAWGQTLRNTNANTYNEDVF